MKLTTEQLRVIFEEWCSRNGFNTTISEDGYVNNYTSDAWKVYQACYDQFYSIHISDYTYKQLLNACRLANIDEETYMKIKAYMPVLSN